MTIINNIYKVNYMKDKFSYVGLLRNEKKFNLNDNVFFSFDSNEISYGKIVGVELLPAENPEYKYKIELAEGLIKLDKNNVISNLICNNIFNTIEEAKESAIKNLERMAKLQKEEIDRYFNRFNQ